MLCQVLISGVDIRLITAGVGDSGFQVIRDDDLRDTAKKLKGMDMSFDPGG